MPQKLYALRLFDAKTQKLSGSLGEFANFPCKHNNHAKYDKFIGQILISNILPFAEHTCTYIRMIANLEEILKQHNKTVTFFSFSFIVHIYCQTHLFVDQIICSVLYGQTRRTQTIVLDYFRYLQVFNT